MTKNNNESQSFFCRVCTSEKIEEFKINHYGFPGKNESWKNFFCFDCGSVSDFKIGKSQTNYTDGSFRSRDYFNLKSHDIKVLPPIDPWSVMSFGRWRHIYKFLKRSSEVFSNREIKMLDFGGYNGFLPYAFNQKHKINSYVADLDPKGLKIAKLLGSNTINLSENKIEEKNFDLITAVHVLEHLEKPKENLEQFKNLLSERGVIYAEVPNLYGFPLMTKYHNIAFSQQSLIKLFKSVGYKILDCGFINTPKEFVKLGHIYGHNTENIYLICNTKEKNLTLNFPKEKIPRNIKEFKYNLKLKYAELMFKNISYILLRPSLGNFMKSIIYFIYGLIDFITLKFFKISLIGKILKQK